MGTESFGLPEFTSVALGKYGVISNYGGHRQWCTPENSILVNPCGKIPVYDNMFFRPGPWNNGCFYDFNDDEFLFSCEEAVKKFQSNPINEKGLELQQKFNYTEIFQQILKEI
jgi:hypothetical protein